MRPLKVTLVLVIALGLVGAANAATATAPRTLYTRLLTKNYPPSLLPSGFFSATVSLSKPGKTALSHHIVGEVEVDISGPDVNDGLLYAVFPTSADAKADIHGAHVLNTSSETLQGPVPGVPHSVWYTGSIVGKNALGHKVTEGVTAMVARVNNVVVAALTGSGDNTDSGNTPGAIALLKSGIRHLHAVGG